MSQHVEEDESASYYTLFEFTGDFLALVNEGTGIGRIRYGTTFDRGTSGIGYYILLKTQNSKWMIEKQLRAWVR